jgi:hypothetical protein
MIALLTFSSCESNPQARVPKPRKAALKPAQRAIRRYFLSALTWVGAMLASVVNCPRGSVTPFFCGRCAARFFVALPLFYDVQLCSTELQQMRREPKSSTLTNCLFRVIHHGDDRNAT